MAANHHLAPTSANEFGLIEFQVVIEHPKHIYNLHHLSLQRYHEGPQVVRKLLDLREGSGNMLNFRTWTSRPVLSIARLQMMSFTSYGLEAQRYPIPVMIRTTRHDPYLSPRLNSPETFPSAVRLQEHLSTEHQIPRSRIQNAASMRATKAIMISFETSKLAVSIFGLIILTIAVFAGIIAGALSRKFEVGIAVTSALVAIMAVAQSFFR